MTVQTATGLLCDFMPGAGPFDVPGDTYLDVPSTGDASTPDTGVLDITGDIDIRVEATLEDWSPPLARYFVSKYVITGNQRSFFFAIGANGRLILQWSADGITPLGQQATVAVTPFPKRRAFRVTMDVNDGAGNRVITFYESTSITGTWTQISQITTAGTTSIFSSSALMEVGNTNNNGSTGFGGRIHAAEVRNGIAGTVVANPAFSGQAPGTTSFSDSAGRTWTVNSPAVVTGFNWVALTGDDALLSASWTVGRSDELVAFPESTADLVFKNDKRRLDPEYTAGPWFGLLKPRTPFRLRSISSALDLPGTAGATASTPDVAAYNVTDLDVRTRLAMDDWTPGGLGQFLVGQWPNVGGNNGWVLSMNTSGQPVLTWTANGTTQLARTCSAATGFVDGTDHWLRCTLDVDNGAAGHTVVWYTSSDGVTWTQLGTTSTTAGTTSIFNSTAVIAVGDILSLAGTVRSLEVRNGIAGTVVTNPDFSAQRPGTVTFRDRSDQTWTVNGTGVIVSDTVTATDQFYGFVEDGFKQVYSPPEQAECEIHLVDMLKVLNGAPLPPTAYDAEVLADNPLVLWKQDERAGNQMADSSGNGRHGFYDNGVLGQESLVFGGVGSVEYPHVGDNRGRWSGEGLPVGPPCTLEVWVKTPRDAAAIKSVMVVQRDASLGQRLWFGIETSGSGSPNGEVVVDFAGLGTGYKARGHSRVDDDRPHHVVVTIADSTAAGVLLYVDGVAQTKTTVSGTNPGSWPSLLLWTVGNYTDNGYGDFGVDGLIDEPAVYDYALTPDRVLAHYQAGADAFDTEFTGPRINRALDVIGVPDAFRDIATGDTSAGPAAYSGSTAGRYIAGVVESEQGYFYVNHRDGGKLKFRGRYARLTEARSTTTLWAFTDADTAGALHYERSGLNVDPNAIASMVNTVDVTWRGGVQPVVDQASVDTYGPQSRSIRTEAPTPEAAESAGAWMINKYAEPQVRVRGFTLRPDGAKDLWPAALDLQVSDRITVTRQPQSVGAATTNTLAVEGLTHTVESTGWKTDVRTSTAAATGSAWIWDVSTWGETTVWG